MLTTPLNVKQQGPKPFSEQMTQIVSGEKYQNSKFKEIKLFSCKPLVCNNHQIVVFFLSYAFPGFTASYFSCYSL